MKTANIQSERGPLIDPWWRKARITGRLLLKREGGRARSSRDRRLAVRFAEDPGVTNRLLDQAVHSITARRQNGFSNLDIID